jgi:UrcA family protein
MRIPIPIAAAAAAIALACAPAAFAAEGMVVDLKGLDLSTPADMTTAKARVVEAATAYCSVYIPGAPKVMSPSKMSCRLEVTQRGLAMIEEARVKVVAAKASPQTLASR